MNPFAAHTLFDTDWYLASNPDVAAAVHAGTMSAYDHFLQFGAKEGRSPTPLFDPAFYLAQNRDVAQAVSEGIFSATEHFLMYGLNEARAFHPLFNMGAYLGANPDVAAAASAGHSPVLHLVLHGAAEGRDLGNGLSLSSFRHDSVFQEAISNNNPLAALARFVELAPIPEPSLPEPWIPGPSLPEPWVPDPDLGEGISVVALTAPGWQDNNAKNTVSFTLEFDSAVKLEKISLAGSGTWSQVVNSSTQDGVTVAHVQLSARNKEAHGVFEIHLREPSTGAKDVTMYIRDFTQNDIRFEDTVATVGGKKLVVFEPVGAVAALVKSMHAMAMPEGAEEDAQVMFTDPNTEDSRADVVSYASYPDMEAHAGFAGGSDHDSGFGYSTDDLMFGWY